MLRRTDVQPVSSLMELIAWRVTVCIYSSEHPKYRSIRPMVHQFVWSHSYDAKYPRPEFSTVTTQSVHRMSHPLSRTPMAKPCLNDHSCCADVKPTGWLPLQQHN